MAVCPFCLPWPRTSVTVMPEICSFSRAALTSSTLLGRTIDLISFMRTSLQDAFQIVGQLELLLRRQHSAIPGQMKDINGPAPLGGNQHQIDVTARLGHREAHT